MGRFTGIEAFVHTAEARSFRAAAARLAVSPAAVSKAVSQLEEELGVRLLNRTTRSVATTAEGDVYLKHCREALDALQAGVDLVSRSAKAPQGQVRVSLSPVLGRTVLEGLDRLLSRHPRIDLRLSFVDRYVNLVDDDVDIAVRIAELDDSSLVARRLRDTRWVTVASPAYLARTSAPRVPADLDAHECLRFAGPRGTMTPWQYRVRDAVIAAEPRGRVVLDHGDLLVDAAIAGLGICHVFDFLVEPMLRDGRLVEVLADHALPGPPIHALCLPRRQATPRVRVVLDHLVTALGAATARRSR